jgi:hypothetical protein
VDFGLYKNFSLRRSQSFSVRLEVFNLFNAVQYAFPALSISTPATFGTITGTNGLYIPRTIQLGFRFRY